MGFPKWRMQTRKDKKAQSCGGEQGARVQENKGRRVMEGGRKGLGSCVPKVVGTRRN